MGKMYWESGTAVGKIISHPGGGGGGGTSICMHTGYVPRERPPFFSPKFPFRSISFSQMTKKSGPEHHHFTFFAVPETIMFKISFKCNPFIASHCRLSPNAKRSAAPRVSGRPECQPKASWQFRRPAFSPSKRLKLGPEPRIFTLDRGARSGARANFSLCRGTYLPKFGGEYPPPGGGGATHLNESTENVPT